MLVVKGIIYLYYCVTWFFYESTLGFVVRLFAYKCSRYWLARFVILTFMRTRLPTSFFLDIVEKLKFIVSKNNANIPVRLHLLRIVPCRMAVTSLWKKSFHVDNLSRAYAVLISKLNFHRIKTRGCAVWHRWFYFEVSLLRKKLFKLDAIIIMTFFSYFFNGEN